MPSSRCFHRWTVSRLLEALESYQPPRESRRHLESARVWKPLYRELQKLLHQTVEDDWPLQAFPTGWQERAAAITAETQELLRLEVYCHYPQRSDSNFGHLLKCVTQASLDPTRLTGREVGLCRAILKQATDLSGPEPGEAESLSAPERDILALKERLLALDPDSGLEHPGAFLDDFPNLPMSLREKVQRAALQSAHDYLDTQESTELQGLLSLHGVNHGTVGKCLQAWLDLAPWLTAGRRERNLLSGLLDGTGHYFDPDWNPLKYAERIAPLLQDSLYSSYYRIPVERLAQHAERLRDDGRSKGREAIRQERELRTALGGDIFALRLLGVGPQDPEKSFERVVRYCAEMEAYSEVKPYREKRRRTRVSLAVRQGVGLLSQCSKERQQELLSRALDIGPTRLWQGLDDCRKNLKNWHVVPVWQAEEAPTTEN